MSQFKNRRLNGLQATTFTVINNTLFSENLGVDYAEENPRISKS